MNNKSIFDYPTAKKLIKAMAENISMDSLGALIYAILPSKRANGLYWEVENMELRARTKDLRSREQFLAIKETIILTALLQGKMWSALAKNDESWRNFDRQEIQHDEDMLNRAGDYLTWLFFA